MDRDQAQVGWCCGRAQVRSSVRQVRSLEERENMRPERPEEQRLREWR